MKKMMITALILVLAQIPYGQTRPQVLETIRKQFQAINADAHLEKLELSGEDFLDEATDGGAQLTGFFKKDSLVKMVAWIGISYGNRTQEFYLQDGKLFFAYVKFEAFVPNDSLQELDRSKTQVSFEGRYYFHDNKLVEKKIRGKYPLEEEQDERNRPKMLQSDAKDFARRLIQSHKKSQH